MLTIFRINSLDTTNNNNRLRTISQGEYVTINAVYQTHNRIRMYGKVNE
jgi:hypothetical protein